MPFWCKAFFPGSWDFVLSPLVGEQNPSFPEKQITGLEEE